MANAVQWTVDQLIGQLKDIESRGRRLRDSISRRNGQLITLDQKANTITDPARRAVMKATIARLVKRQAELKRSYEIFAQRFQQASSRAIAFLRSHGIMHSSELSGLGIAPLAAAVVGASIVGAIVLARTGLEYGERKDAVQREEFAFGERQYQDLVARGVDPARAAELAARMARDLDSKDPGFDPFGLANLTEAIVPLVLIVAAALILPPVLEGFNRRRLA